MNLVIIFGPPAVGKLTISSELAKLNGYRIIHKQEIFDLLDDFFFFGTDNYRQADQGIRKIIINEASKVKHIKGLIMTFVWAFNDSRDKSYIEEVLKLANKRKIKIYFVELQSTELERRERVRSASRKVAKKVSTLAGLKKLEKDKVWKSDSKYFEDKRYLKLDNTVLTAEKCAELIFEEFDL